MLGNKWNKNGALHLNAANLFRAPNHLDRALFRGRRHLELLHSSAKAQSVLLRKLLGQVLHLVVVGQGSSFLYIL